MKTVFLSIIVSLIIFFRLESQELTKGFFNYSWSDSTGKIHLFVPHEKLDHEFLYVNSLAAGAGSNDIGLDRGQIGGSRIVKFIKTGEKLLLIQPNQDYRSVSDNPKEVQAVEEAFAQSVLWGFKIDKNLNDSFRIDLTPFLLRDAHNVIARLKNTRQGTYKLDASRSGIWKTNTLNFPKNSEFESILTFTGEPAGRFIRSVTPSPNSVTLRQHHSFIELPDNQYTPRSFHPYSGFFGMSYADYATPIYEPLQKRFIVRHRLKKKNPSAQRSEAVEPIIYYLDPGCPEPVKSALIEGAKWWNQAFESAGYIDAFQVRELPDGVHPLDIRYNMIQWVHRSTRGWSYGSSVTDPRTGEIIKGQVSLGSLRVRQDFLIAQGLMSPYGEGNNEYNPMLDLALARLRQLAAHEVGHTLGLAHNFASSTNERASVMDYPHPYIDIDDAQNLSFESVYDTNIGEWDKRTILYGYQDFPDDVNQPAKLLEIIDDTQNMGLRYMSDRDARPQGSANPYGHLWDNGENTIDELKKLLVVRKTVLDKMGENSIPEVTPYSELEKVLVPVYLLHRYQIEAVSKLIGGVEYTYAVKGDQLNHEVRPVALSVQQAAIKALLSAINPEELIIPEKLTRLISPPAMGYSRDRESFSTNTGLPFDPVAAAEGLANHTISYMLNTQRLSRIIREPHNSKFNNRLGGYLRQMTESIFGRQLENPELIKLHLVVQNVYFTKLLEIFSSDSVDKLVTPYVQRELEYISDKLPTSVAENSIYSVSHHRLQTLFYQALEDPAKFVLPKTEEMPPGAPIGCDWDDRNY